MKVPVSTLQDCIALLPEPGQEHDELSVAVWSFGGPEYVRFFPSPTGWEVDVGVRIEVDDEAMTAATRAAPLTAQGYGRAQGPSAVMEAATAAEARPAKWREGAKLKWPDVWENLKMHQKGGKGKAYWKWIVTDETPPEVRTFLNDFGYTYVCGVRGEVHGLNAGQLAVALLNTGFAKYLCQVLPDLARTVGITEDDEV